MLDEEEDDEEVVVMGLGSGGLDEDEGEGACYTELKPSTTLLVPLELAEEALGRSNPHQPLQLLDGGTLGTMVSADPTVTPAGGFSLMLEAEEEEEEESEAGEGENQATEEVDAGGEPEEVMELPQEDQQARTPELADQEQVDTPALLVSAPQEEVAEVQADAQVADAVALEDTSAQGAMLLSVSADSEMPKEEEEEETASDATALLDPPKETEAEQVSLTPEAETGQEEQEVQQDTRVEVEAAGPTVVVLEEEEPRASAEEDLAETPVTAEESPAEMETQTEEPIKNVQEEPNQVVEEEEEGVPEPEEVLQPQASVVAAADTDLPQEPDVEETPSAEAAPSAVEVEKKGEEKSTVNTRAGKGRSTRMSDRTATAAEIADATYDISPPVTTRKTNSRKNVTFISPIVQVEKELSANEGSEEQAEDNAQVPAKSRRSTRSGKQLPDVQIPVTPRRRTRQTEPEPKEKVVEEEEEAPSATTTVNSKPSTSKRQTPQKATPRKGGRRTRSSADTEDPVAEKPSVEVPETGRRSTRKTRNTSILEVPEVPAVVSEAKPAEEPPRSASSSPGRVTRSSARGVSLSLDSFQAPPGETAAVLVTPPRSRRKTRATTAEKAKVVADIPDETAPPSGTAAVRRLTRSRHWKDMEEDDKEKKEELGIMDTTVELVPGTPLGDALMERLQEEAAGGVAGAGGAVTEIIRAKRRTTRAAAAPLTSVLESEDMASDQANADADTSAMAEPPEPAPSPSRRRTRTNKAPEPEPSTEANSFTFTPTRRTRGESGILAKKKKKL